MYTVITVQFLIKFSQYSRLLVNLDMTGDPLLHDHTLDYIEEEYCKQLSPKRNGRHAHPARLAFAALFVRSHMGFSQERTVQEMKENFYIRYLAGAYAFYDIPDIMKRAYEYMVWLYFLLKAGTFSGYLSPRLLLELRRARIPTKLSLLWRLAPPRPSSPQGAQGL